MDHAVAQHHRLQPASHRDPLTTRRKARPNITGKAGQTSGYTLPTTSTTAHISLAITQRGRSVDSG
jgi:hypothetical protein